MNGSPLISMKLNKSMLNTYGLTNLESRVKRLYPNAKFLFNNFIDRIYVKLTCNNATIHIEHFKYSGHTLFEFERFGLFDHECSDWVNPLLYGSTQKVMDMIFDYIIKYLKPSNKI